MMVRDRTESESVRFEFLGAYIGMVKWTAMIGAIGWVLIYRLSEEAARIPEFVYVNF